MQRTTGFQALLAMFNSVFPFQSHLNEHMAFRFFALSIKDEVTRGLILNSWRKKGGISTSFPLVTAFDGLE